MTTLLAKVDGSGSELASWSPLLSLLIIFAVIVVALIAFGRSGNVESRVAKFLLRTPDALERVTRVPGWAAAVALVVAVPSAPATSWRSWRTTFTRS